MSCDTLPSALPAVHPFSVLGEFVVNKDRWDRVEKVRRSREPLIGSKNDLGTDRSL